MYAKYGVHLILAAVVKDVFRTMLKKKNLFCHIPLVVRNRASDLLCFKFDLLWLCLILVAASSLTED